MNLRNVRIGTRLGAGFGISLIVLALAVGVMDAVQREQGEGFARHAGQASDGAASLATMQVAVLEAAFALQNAGPAGEPAEKRRLAQEFLEKYRVARMRHDANASEAERRHLVQADAAVAGLSRLEPADDALPLQLRPLVRQALDSLVKAQHMQQQESGAALDAIRDGTAGTFRWIAMLCAAALVLGGLTSWQLTVSITRPLQSAVSIARRVANGDLTSQPVISGKDEVSELLQSLKSMNDNLRKLVGEVRQGTDSIAISAKEIAAGNADLSVRTETQAQSLNETASAMESLTANVMTNAASARTARDAVVASSGIAVRGGESAQQVAHTMADIEDSSRRIADITGVIDSIAFQTNILALNAAVEAARAGEHGRGFAVVAGEVRALAQRAALAAKEIKDLTADSLDKVNDGNTMAAGAGETMKEIVDSVHSVTVLIGEIASASQEQASSIEEVNLAVAQMDEMTQRNAALVEQAAAAAASMQEQAVALANAVSVFRLESNSVEAVEMVKRAAARIREHGAEPALAAFNKPEPEFRQRDLYINVIDQHGNTLAHGDNNKLVGKNLIDLKDADGKPFIREFIDVARNRGSGWIEYRWPNPLTGIAEAKSTYVKRVDDLVVGCGIYK